jgi:hypothetical protein
MPTLRAILTVAACLALVGPAYADRLVRDDGTVKIYSRDPILPHGYGDMVLEFKGKHYSHLISASYALTPDKKAIIFVTRKEGASAELHFVPFGEVGEMTLDIGDTAFGIGLGFPKDDYFAHYIDKVDGAKITFIAKFGKNGKIARFQLDLRARTFTELSMEVN